jgi:hypothetical protein
LFCASHLALAEDAISHPAKKPIGPTTNEMVPSLAVLNSKGATLQGNKLTLVGVSPIVFDFNYDGPGPGKGGTGVLTIDGKEVANQKFRTPFRSS